MDEESTLRRTIMRRKHLLAAMEGDQRRAELEAEIARLQQRVVEIDAQLRVEACR